MERIRLGQKDGQVGLWISAPGKDISSTVFEDLLVDTTRINTQPLVKGFINGTTLNFDIARTEPIKAKQGLQLLINQTTGAAQYYLVWLTGMACYSLTIPHNLGYIPLCHLSVQSPYAGTPYPSFYIDENYLRLIYYETWDVTAPTWNGSTYTNNPDGKPDSYQFYCDFHYTLFRQQAV